MTSANATFDAGLDPKFISVTDPGIYKETKLPPESTTFIRVLDLEAYIDPIEARIRCQLRLVNLADNPSFTALSYEWGDVAASTDAILCNGHSIHVTRNCYDALVQLRETFGAITIWVDSICINQSDATEKRTQIPLMRTIFPAAKEVYVWLGKGTKDTDDAMEFLARGGLPTRKQVDFSVGETCYQTSSMRIQVAFSVLVKTLLVMPKPYSTGLEDVLNRGWRRRLWTLVSLLDHLDGI
jgi:hypothetical protein